MSDQLAVAAEIQKLGRALGSELDQFDGFERHSPEVLRDLRRAFSAVLFNENRRAFQRLEKASRLLPNALVAMLTVKVMGPMIAGRVSGEMPPRRGVSIARRLPVPFLADVCIYMDPRDAPDLVRGIPVPLIRQIAAVLLKRRDYVTMAQFVDILSDSAIQAVIDDMGDAADLLHIGFYVEDPEHLDAVISLLPEQRLAEILESAADQKLWPHTLVLLRHVGQANRDRLLAAVSAAPRALQTSLLGAADALDDAELQAALLPLREKIST